MRSKQNKKYTCQFKLSVVELYLSSEVSYQELTLALEEHLSQETVKLHTRHIKKLDFRTVSELVSYLKSQKIVETFNLFS